MAYFSMSETTREGKDPKALTAEEMRQWQEIERQIAASPPHFPTAVEALQHTRKRP